MKFSPEEVAIFIDVTGSCSRSARALTSLVDRIQVYTKVPVILIGASRTVNGKFKLWSVLEKGCNLGSVSLGMGEEIPTEEELRIIAPKVKHICFISEDFVMSEKIPYKDITFHLYGVRGLDFSWSPFEESVTPLFYEDKDIMVLIETTASELLHSLPRIETSLEKAEKASVIREMFADVELD